MTAAWLAATCLSRKRVVYRLLSVECNADAAVGAVACSIQAARVSIQGNVFDAEALEFVEAVAHVADGPDARRRLGPA